MAKLKDGVTTNELAIFWARKTARICKQIRENNSSVEKSFKLFMEGFMDGIADNTISHPYEGIPPVRKSMNQSYCSGFDLGEQFANCSEVFESAPSGERSIEEML